MTEAEWAVCCKPYEMLACLQETGSASERKLRLLACACVRRLWPLLIDDRSRQAVEVGERFADGTAGVKELRRANGRAAKAACRVRGGALGRAAWAVGFGTGTPRGIGWDTPATRAVWWAVYRVAEANESVPESVSLAEQAALLRDIFDPFRKLGPPAPSCSAPTILSLAQRAYVERQLPSGNLDPAHLSALADALASAGCTVAALLSHLRGPGPHVRGCFALDAILGRN